METSDEPTPEVLPWNEDTKAGSQLRKNTLETAKEMGAPGPEEIGPVNGRFAAVVDYQNYRIMKN